MFVILSMLRIRIKKIKNGTGLHFVHSALANLKIYPVLTFFLPFSPFSLFPCAFIFYCFPNGPDAFFKYTDPDCDFKYRLYPDSGSTLYLQYTILLLQCCCNCTVCPGSSDPPEIIFRFTPFINYYDTLG